MLTRYKAVALDDDQLHMVRREVPGDPPRYGEEYNYVTEINREIVLPKIDGPIWATIDLKPTVIGRAALAIFRLPQVHIEITFDDGSKILHRFIPQMGEAGFLLSPYVSNANQFLGLTWGHSKQRAVKSIRLTAGGRFLWKSKFDLVFRSLEFAPEPDSKKLLVLGFLPSFHLDTPAKEAAECAVDYIDGRLLKPASTEIKIDANYFSIQGWAAPAAKQGAGPDKIVLSLTDDLGQVRYYAPKIQHRTDVKAYFGHPEMSDPGFERFWIHPSYPAGRN